MTATVQAVPDLTHEEYLALPGLSSHGAKLLLPPSVPARYRWDRDHPPGPRQDFDLGHVVHGLVLGIGTGVRVGDFTNRRTNAWKAFEAETRDAGLIPVLPAQMAEAEAMAAAVLNHPVAGRLFDRDHGSPEVSLTWEDPATGTRMKGRPDWIGSWQPGGNWWEAPEARQACIVDLKTTDSAEYRSFSRSMGTFGYHLQPAFYGDGAREALGWDDPTFHYVAVEKKPPYLVAIYTPDARSLQIGRQHMAHAIEIYSECTATGRWPGYPADPQPISLPAWFEKDN